MNKIKTLKNRADRLLKSASRLKYQGQETCYFCPKKFTKKAPANTYHIIPAEYIVSRWRLDNVVLSCPKCNLTQRGNFKGDSEMTHYIAGFFNGSTSKNPAKEFSHLKKMLKSPKNPFQTEKKLRVFILKQIKILEKFIFEKRK